MSILTLKDYLASAKQKIIIHKTGTRSSYAAVPCSVFDLAGNPPAGVLNIGNTANGTVPTSSTAGYPSINPIANTGYLTKIKFSWSVTGLLYLYDRVFAAGAYAFNTDTTLSSQPSYAGRIPNGNFNSTELWVECVTNFTGIPSIQINYLDQDGNAGDTGVLSIGYAMTIGDSLQMPLASGDTGVQQITRVRCTVASAGTFNVSVHKPIWSNRVPDVTETASPLTTEGVDDFIRTGLKQVYSTTAFFMQVSTDDTDTGYPRLELEVCDA